MRELIANAVASDPEEYSEAILGKPNKSYCEWIMKPDSWGGGIEVSILSKFYGLEIVVVNSVSGIISRFGEDQHYSHRVFLIFDGIHYDPLYMEPFNVSILICYLIFLMISYLIFCVYLFCHREEVYKPCFQQIMNVYY